MTVTLGPGKRVGLVLTQHSYGLRPCKRPSCGAHADAWRQRHTHADEDEPGGGHPREVLVCPLQEAGWLSQSSTPDSSLAFMSSGAAEARTD